MVLRFAVPDIDPQDVQVTYKDGILTIRLPLEQEHAAPTRIPVERG